MKYKVELKYENTTVENELVVGLPVLYCYNKDNPNDVYTQGLTDFFIDWLRVKMQKIRYIKGDLL